LPGQRFAAEGGRFVGQFGAEAADGHDGAADIKIFRAAKISTAITPFAAKA
jgi:hypothetical protein